MQPNRQPARVIIRHCDDYDPQRIFAFLRDQVGYESYVGSLRGARGTLWSAAGNALDEASLGVALLRSSGIPARYARGTLADDQAKELILSMFPPVTRAVGGLPAANPAGLVVTIRSGCTARGGRWRQSQS